MKIVPDTSVIIDGRVTTIVKSGRFKENEIIISEAALSELEAQANQGQETGMSGLEEIQNLKEMADNGEIELTFKGERPSLEQVELASGGEIDHMIRELAKGEEAALLTSDIVQAEIAKAKGITVEYLEPVYHGEGEGIEIWDYFEEDYMSVHLRTGIEPRAKIGIPGNVSYQKIREEVSRETDLRRIAHQIIEGAKRSSEGFIEIDKGGATIVQLEDLRVVISRPPFSDGFEITAVRPVAKVTIDDYDMSEELKERLSEKQRGVLLAGSPGAGKSTLAQAIAEYLVKKDFIVKTMEEPRDLQVVDEITQYTSLDGDISETADVLLLVRPDYTIYDEVRKTPHFKVFADMRLAGVGMIGVTHANRAIDALQRLIGRVELGMVPQVVDTVVFVDEASIGKVYDINYTVKVPAGMMEQDLARPVIEVRDFETGEPEYEIYSFGEQVVVMPIEAGEGAQTSPVWYYAEREIEDQMSRYVRGPVDVEVTSPDSIKVYLRDDQIPAILGKGGKRIKEIEEDMGLNINVNSLKERGKAGKQKASRQPRESVDVYEEKGKVTILAGGHRSGDKVDVFAGRDFLFNATVGGDGTISIRKSTEAAKSLLKKFRKGKNIKIS